MVRYNDATRFTELLMLVTMILLLVTYYDDSMAVGPQGEAAKKEGIDHSPYSERPLPTPPPLVVSPVNMPRAVIAPKCLDRPPLSFGCVTNY